MLLVGGGAPDTETSLSLSLDIENVISGMYYEMLSSLHFVLNYDFIGQQWLHNF